MKQTNIHAHLTQSFRHYYGALVANLTSQFSPWHLDSIEDIAQEALCRAMETWPLKGIPNQPLAWLKRTAYNLAIDQLRQKKNWHNNIQTHIKTAQNSCDEIEPPINTEIRLMCLCCLPTIKADDQILLILKLLCGFSHNEIAAAFLSSCDAIKKRITRARNKAQASPVLPDLENNLMVKTLPVLHKALYLLFNEGYHSQSGTDIIRKDLCDEAIRLTHMLVNIGTNSSSCALLSLMLLHRARLNSRINNEGGLILLRQQDRSLWDTALITQGIEFWQRSQQNEMQNNTALSQYHLEAGIAAMHCMAKSEADTNWQAITGLYDLMLQLTPSPVIQLNRLIAMSKWQGISAITTQLQKLDDSQQLEQYPYFQVFYADCAYQQKQFSTAKQRYKKALTLTHNHSDRLLIKNKISLLPEN